MTTELDQTEPTVGQRLKQAREQQNLTAQQVALQLNLKSSLIDDLESDRIEQKLSPTFYRGYLRSYARLLKLNEQELLQQYNQQNAGQQHTPSLTRSFSKRTAKEASDSRYMWLTWLVVIGFILLLVMYFWQNRMDGQVAAVPLPVVNAEQKPAQQEEQSTQVGWQSEPAVSESGSTAMSGLDASPMAVSVQPEPTTAAEPAEVITTASEQESATQVVDSATTVSKPADTLLSQPLDLPHTGATQEPAQEAVVNPALTETTPSSAAPAEAANATLPTMTEQQPPVSAEVPAADTAIAPDTQLALSFSDDCWVDISDATGKRLAYGSRRSGDQLSLAGVAPIKVLLGNAAVVSLTLNGQAYDLSRYPQGRVARLTLGQ